MANVLHYGGMNISYDIIFNPVLSKKIRIHVHPNSQIEVEAPNNYCSKKIEDAVRKRARWIIKQLETTQRIREHTLPREYISGETHFYIGKRYPLKVIKNRELQSKVKLKAGRIEIITRSSDPVSVKRRLNNWYKSKSENYFEKRLQLFADKISWIENMPSLKLITMKKQWGSCSPNGSIHLNPWLIRAPVDCIDYVIIHELCHLREHNHSKKYYDLLQQHHPNWKHVKAKLDGMAERLLAE